MPDTLADAITRALEKAKQDTLKTQTPEQIEQDKKTLGEKAKQVLGYASS